MSSETENNEGLATQALSAAAGSVSAHLQAQLEIVGAFFDKHNADEIQRDALDRLRESIALILGYAEMQRKCKLAAHDRLDQAYDHFFSQNDQDHTRNEGSK